MMKRFLYITALLLLLSSSLCAQKLLWNISFDTKFDNHEFEQMELGQSKTLFGLFLTPEIGLGWGEDSHHSLMLGGNVIRLFGDYITPLSSNFIAYYRFNNEHFNVLAGAFPQGDSFSDFSTAFISDDKRFNDVVMEGVKFEYRNKRGYFKLIFDWPLRNHDYTSEILTFYSSANFAFKWFYLGYLFDMNHYAIDINTKNVVDNIWVNPFAGFSFADYTPFEALDLRLGWIQTIQNDRVNLNKYYFPCGGQVDVTIQKWGVGIHNSLYVGNNLMPYYNTLNSFGDIYGSMLYYGDVMYSTESGLYNRLEAYWKAFTNDVLDVNVSVVMHADKSGGIGWQQKASVSVNLDNFSWKRMLDKKAGKKQNDEKD